MHGHTRGVTGMVAAVLMIALLVPGTAAAQKFPARAITIQVPFTAGGSTDVAARAMAEVASKSLGVPVVVTNVAGGGGAVMLGSLKNERPDGYTLGVLTTGAVSAQYLRSVPFRVLEDFTPVMQFVAYPSGLLVKADAPWKTFAEFMKYVEDNPGKVRYSSAGTGLAQQLVMEQLKLTRKVTWTHVPFNGGIPALTALMGGNVEAAVATTEFRPYVDSQRLRLLAVLSEKRIPAYPEVSTLKELGLNIARDSFLSLVGPRGIPADVVKVLDAAFAETLRHPDVIRAAERLDMILTYRGAEALRAYLESTDRSVRELISKLGLEKK